MLNLWQGIFVSGLEEGWENFASWTVGIRMILLSTQDWVGLTSATWSEGRRIPHFAHLRFLRRASKRRSLSSSKEY